MKFITIGSDPEFFVLDPAGRPYPATKFSRGTKDAPSPIGDGFFEQRDNLSFEGNIPPASTKKEFIRNVTHLREYFANKVGKFGYSLSSNGVEYFDKRFLELPEANEFGCSRVISSWDSGGLYGISERATPLLYGVRYRVSGFHIHIGYEDFSIFGATSSRNNLDILIGRLFDLFLTIPSHKIKPEPERIKSYGQYGMIRSRPYGVECRTLSTYFTQEKWLPWVWNQIMKIEKFINVADPRDLEILIGHRRIINTHDPIRTFEELFSQFGNKDIFKKFTETKELNYGKVNKSMHEKVEKSEHIVPRYSNHYYSTNTDTTSSSW